MEIYGLICVLQPLFIFAGKKKKYLFLVYAVLLIYLTSGCLLVI